MHRSIGLLVGFAAVVMVRGVSFGQLALDANFDQGSLRSWSGDVSNISLSGRTNYFDTGWRWMYFKASGVLNATPTFTINQNFAGDATPGPHELQEHEFVYSVDNEHWSFFDNNQLVAQNVDRFQFSNATPFTQNTVYVAYAIPYPYAKSVAHVQTVLASPWARPTASANASGVIGQTRAGVDDLGRSIPALNLYGYHITDSSVPEGGKRKVGLATGLHAGEPLGTYAYEGLVNWLISADPRAAALRKAVNFFCYPVLNPSGRYAGLNRSTVANIDRDPNGLWNDSIWNTSANRNAYQDIRVTGLAMINDVYHDSPAGLDAFIDFHSTVPDYDNPTGRPNDFGFIDQADAETDWWLEVQRLNGGNLIQYANSGSGSFTSTGFARRKLGARTEITLETQFTWERNTDYYNELGASFGVAFYNSWVAVPEPSGAVALVGMGVVGVGVGRRRHAGLRPGR